MTTPVIPAALAPPKKALNNKKTIILRSYKKIANSTPTGYTLRSIELS